MCFLNTQLGKLFWEYFLDSNTAKFDIKIIILVIIADIYFPPKDQFHDNMDFNTVYYFILCSIIILEDIRLLFPFNYSMARREIHCGICLGVWILEALS